MDSWQPVIDFDDVIEGGINKAEMDGRKLILLLAEGELFVYEDACPHEGHPLSLGELEGEVLTCTKHLWEFDVRTGKHVSRIHRPKCDLRSFRARVVDGMVQVELPEA